MQLTWTLHVCIPISFDQKYLFASPAVAASAFNLPRGNISWKQFALFEALLLILAMIIAERVIFYTALSQLHLTAKTGFSVYIFPFVFKVFVRFALAFNLPVFVITFAICIQSWH